MSEREREEAASALTAFLGSLSLEKSLSWWEERGNPKKGKVLFEGRWVASLVMPSIRGSGR